MNSLNPLHIGALLAITIAFLFVKLDSAKVELKEAQASYKMSEKLAVDVKALKSLYADKKKIKRSIDKLLANRALKSAQLSVKHSKNRVTISSKSIETSALNTLLGKVLNGTYNVTELKIRKLSETKASLQMEIQW